MDFEACKTIIRPVKESEYYFPVDYNMNIYRGCCHGCIYCDSRSLCYHVDNFNTVRGKEDAIKIIKRELAGKRKSGIIGTGAMTDPYNFFEEKYNLTRQSLFLMDIYGYGIGITTKSPLVLRDIDLFKSISGHSPAYVTFSITAAKDSLSEMIEPNVASTKYRIKALKELSDNGVFAGVWLNPLLPFITDTPENIRNIVRLCGEAGAKYILCNFGVTMRAGSRDYFYAELEEKFAGIKAEYVKTYGDMYICYSPQRKELSKIFKEECRKYGIITSFIKLNPTIRALAPNRKQVSLFDDL